MVNIKIAGVLNITPDSFHRKHPDTSAALQAAKTMLDTGVAFIDVGAESTNPWSSPITPREEWSRLEPVLSELAKEHPDKISVDTYHPETAQKALELTSGQAIINDITGLSNPAIIEVLAKFAPNVRCIIGHIPKPTVEQSHKNADFDSLPELIKFHEAKTKLLLEAGLRDENIWWDPCIGFGKKPLFNVELLRYAANVPVNRTVMIGYSGKRFLGLDWKTGEPLENYDEVRKGVDKNLEAAEIVIDSAQQNQTVYIRIHDNMIHEHLQLPSVN